jgi:AAA family ATP:ADP antiporter
VTETKQRNPLRAILDIRREEWPLALLMFAYFFLVITTFWILKPIKKGLFIEFYDESGVDFLGWQLDAAQAELIAKVMNMVVALVAVVVFSALARSLKRQQLTLVFCGFFAVTLAIYSFLVNDPGDGVVWSFYLYGDLYNTVMVATFFAFLNDSVQPKAAKRLYGLIVLGGVLGGAVGTTFLAVYIDQLGHGAWMWLCVGATAVIAALAWGAGRIVDRAEASAVRSEPEAKQTEEPRPSGGAALEGARLVFRSPYLLAIVAIVGLYEIVSTVLDFQFTATVAHYLDGPAIGEHFSTLFAITNVSALVVQLLVTNAIMNNFSLRVALLVTPVVIFGASGAFLALPLLWPGSLLSTSDNAFNYSINQSAREALYTPTTRDEKYKAKAFIDMFVQRFAKAIAVGVSLILTTVFADFSTVRWLSLFTIAIVGIWLFAAVYAGNRFRALTREDAPDEPHAGKS